MIMKSGSFVLNSTSQDSSEVLKRTLVIQYSRTSQSGENVETMSQENIDNFVQRLGFVVQDGNDSMGYVAFTEMYMQLTLIRNIQQGMMNVGFAYSDACLEYAINNPESPAQIEAVLNESNKEQNQCVDWLNRVRLKYKYSLLFHMDELLCIHHCIANIREGDSVSEDSENVRMIVEAVSRLSPCVSQHPGCLALIVEYLNDNPPKEISWLEEASYLVEKCGKFSAGLNLPCFNAVEPTCHKKTVIHKINCCNAMSLAAPLRLLQRIYKVKRSIA
jgi:hypothetical protein